MKKHNRVPYKRIATDEDKRIWSRIFAPFALVGFVPVTESDVVHWAAIMRNTGIVTSHVLYIICAVNDSYSAKRTLEKPTSTADVNCMTCLVRAEKGPRAT